jgi:hypothetical protein
MKLKTAIFIKCINGWNWLCDSLYSIRKNVCDFYHHILYFFNKKNNLWYIVNGFNAPFRGDTLYNIKYDWMYDVSENKLYKEGKKENKNEYYVAWLSTKLVVDKEEKDMDLFFNDLCIITDKDDLPSMNTLFLAWCIFTRHWYSNDSSIVFHMIDHMANDKQIVYFLQDKTRHFRVNQNKLYLL